MSSATDVFRPRIEERPVDLNHTVRDGSLVGRFPGNELPGYDQTVPSGTKSGKPLWADKPSVHAHIFDSTSQNIFEDEDEDEHE